MAQDTPIWSEKHDKAIERTYQALLEALQTASDADECRGILSSLDMPYGPPEAESAPQRVKRSLANLALTERCYQIQLKANPQPKGA